MPTKLIYRPTLIDKLITNERINSYQSVFSPTNDIELMGVYLWNAHVSSVLYPIIGAAEITLRNAIDQALKPHLGNFWWAGSKLRYSSFAVGAVPPLSVSAVRNNFSSATSKFIKEQKKRYGIKGHVTPTHHGVVAKTEFSTWEFMLSNDFMGNHLIWPSRLGVVFSGKWPSVQASTTLNYARDLVSTVRDFRNRLFHHEPAWKRFGVHTETDAIQHLKEKLHKIESLITLIDPEYVNLLEKNGLLGAARRAFTSQEIQRFQHLSKVIKVNSITKLKSIVDICGTSNSVVAAKIYRGKQKIFYITPR